MFIPAQKGIENEQKFNLAKKVVGKLTESNYAERMKTNRNPFSFSTKDHSNLSTKSKTTNTDFTSEIKSNNSKIPENKQSQSLKDNFLNEEIELDNFVIFLEPNAARFEFHDIENSILYGFLSNDFNILMVNYIGFDSPGFKQFSLHVILSEN